MSPQSQKTLNEKLYNPVYELEENGLITTKKVINWLGRKYSHEISSAPFAHNNIILLIKPFTICDLTAFETTYHCIKPKTYLTHPVRVIKKILFFYHLDLTINWAY